MNIERIIVAMDDEAVSIAALEEAMPIARRVSAEIVLFHVGELYANYPPVDVFAPAAAHIFHEALDARHKAMRDQLGEIRERHVGQGVEISVSQTIGYPKSTLADAEVELRADLVVVGSHGRTGFDRLMNGSISEQVVRRSKRMVLVARSPRTNLPYRRLLVATDFSSASEQALEAALLFADPNAEVTLFHSWQLPSSSMGTNPLIGKLAKGIEAHAHAAMDEMVRKHEGKFVLRKEVAYGYPGQLIRERAPDCDLIALGSRGRRGLERYLLGSVAELTVRHAPCSVLVAHGESQEAPDA